MLGLKRLFVFCIRIIIIVAFSLSYLIPQPPLLSSSLNIPDKKNNLLQLLQHIDIILLKINNSFYYVFLYLQNFCNFFTEVPLIFEGVQEGLL